MAGSSFGSAFRITTFGESHGAALGVVIDGCPAGLPLSVEDIAPYLARRRPGSSRYSTARQEADEVEILSGVFEGKTSGTPIAMLIRNHDQKSRDYDTLADLYRPGHADYGYAEKYGVRDHRGGGRSSGRETVARVAAGAVACKLLLELGISVHAFTRSIGPVSIEHYDDTCENELCMPDADAAARARAYLEECMADKDSAGGVIECVASGYPAGIGDPVFDKLDARLAQAILSVGAVKGFEVGDGFASVRAKGSENNDAFYMDANGQLAKKSNHAGGITGGISDGSEIILRAAVKPTPSIAKPQQTVNKSGENCTIEITGRHDPVIVPRAVVVIECMTALVLADALLIGMGSKLSDLKHLYLR